MDIKGKKIILTGASSGIGYELLRQLLELDCTIIAVARKIEAVELEHPRLIKFPADLSDRQHVDRLFEFAKERFGTVDIFMANAGFAYYEIIEKADWDHIERIFRINTFSSMYSALKMRELNGDRPYNVVITGSAMGLLSLPGYSIYSSTKAAVRGFADGYRFELRRGQHYQVVFPIATRTNFFHEAGDSPVPFPCQEVGVVARRIISGVRKNRKRIYPSYLFLMMYHINRLFPFVLRLEQQIEFWKMKKWLARSGGNR